MAAGARRRAVVLLDGEHHPPGLRAALQALVAAGTDPALVIMVGGGEKMDAPGEPPPLGVDALWPPAAEQELGPVLERVRPDVVVELSGDPVVDPERRLRLAAITLAAGVAYEAPGLRYGPPPRPVLSDRPTVAVIATGKRTGKTALSGAVARRALSLGRLPVIVAMGRGGPPDPTVVPAGDRLDPGRLLQIVAAGGHAASDFYEDAVTTGAATVGCFRVGDGPAGEVWITNVPAGVAAADELPGDLTILEGSGAAIPPCHADAALLVVPARIDPATLRGTLPLSFLLADLIVVTGADDPTLPAGAVTALCRTIGRLLAELPRGDHPPRLTVTGFRPHPLGEVAGRRVYFATTAPQHAGGVLRHHLEAEHRAEIVGLSHHLADRPKLRADLEAAPAYDVLLTELKAAAVDVATPMALDAGAEVVFCDHRVVPVSVDEQPGLALVDDLDQAFDGLLGLADRRRRALPG